jgi:HAD superfamily hydrolase (TIGR01459 family)
VSAALPVPTDLATLCRWFSLFLIDQFGVLHDGTAAYPGAVDALARLKDSGRTIILLSNSGKRAAPNEKRLLALGFKAGSWDHFLSSGEVAWHSLAGQRGADRPQTCFLIARDDDRSAMDGLDLQPVVDAALADVILITASEGDRYPIEHYRNLLAPAAAQKRPAICTNPDKVMLTPKGHRFGAGAIAELYASMGGPVDYIGKPFVRIYEAALALAGNPDLSRVVCIGDSIEHDVAGAKGAGLSACLVRSGILADLDEPALLALFAQHGATPDLTMPAFAWPNPER